MFTLVFVIFDEGKNHYLNEKLIITNDNDEYNGHVDSKRYSPKIRLTCKIISHEEFTIYHLEFTIFANNCRTDILIHKRQAKLY